MRRPSFFPLAWIVLLVSLGVVTSFVWAQAAHTITLAWDYTQSVDRPATLFVVQRGTMSATSCPLADLAKDLPVTSLRYVDTTIISGVKYCYVVMAADAAGRSLPSNQVTGGWFDLRGVGTLLLTVQ